MSELKPAKITDRFRRMQMQMMALGAFLYALGFGAQGFVGTLPLFALSVAIWTLGEMVIAPVATVLVADMAPETLRGRYMGAFGLTWGVGYGLGPTLGGTVEAEVVTAGSPDAGHLPGRELHQVGVVFNTQSWDAALGGGDHNAAIPGTEVDQVVFRC